MTDQEQKMAVSSDELLARFIFYKNHLRQDLTFKPDAFIPYPWPDLSVTRHLELDELELWRIGSDIAEQREKTLHGRADFQAVIATIQKLQVISDPLPENPNHAIIRGWPPDKPAQKIIAQELAAASGQAKRPLQ